MDRDRYQEALSWFCHEKWKNLSLEKKVESLQAVENEIARRCHRLPCEVKAVFMQPCRNGIQLGGYSPVSKDIVLNADQLMPESEYGDNYRNALDTVLHEGRHAYQDQAVSGCVYHENVRELQEWKANMEPGGYIAFSQNPRAYYQQPIEKDARAFAENMGRQIEQEKEQSRQQTEGDRKERLMSQYEKKTEMNGKPYQQQMEKRQSIRRL